MTAPRAPWLLALLALALSFSCGAPSSRAAAAVGPDATVPAPRAKALPTRLEKHGDVRIDDYYWLRERENPAVIAYLEAENAYTMSVTAHTQELQATLFEEIKGRIEQTDQSVPYRQDGYFYYSREADGEQYPVYCRKRGALDAPEEVLLDLNAMAAGHAYFSVGRRTVTSDGTLLAYGTDTTGRRFYTIRFKDLATGATLPDTIPDVTSNIVWAEDDRTLFYAKQDPGTLRSYQIWRHLIGSDVAADELVYEEADETFRCSVSKTRSKAYLLITSSQTLSTEVRTLSAHNPEGEFAVFLPRRRDHEYRLDHFGDWFYVRTNDEARNFRLMRAPVDRPERSRWEVVVPHRRDVLLQGFEIFADHLVLSERKGGLTQIYVRPWSGESGHYLDFGEPTYRARPRDNHELDTSVLRYSYSSFTTPNSVFDYDMVTREKTLLKQDEVLGGFDSSDYVSERIYSKARDGTFVPISLVYRAGSPKDGSRPLLLSGYGSYGASRDASFSAARLSLLDRGFTYAIAHVRGGSEYGRQWYEDGKLLNKRNTFTDFIDCAEHLVGEGYTSEERLFAQGGSAGGLLMGAVANMRPDLFQGIVAAVPFVDVVTTMLDDTIPLTTSEYDEWGNPNDKTYYDYMLSYSPYDQVERQDYPNLLVTTGLHDSQVQYWEPAKWVAKLRAHKTDANLLLLKTTMDAGHGGASGRYRRYEDIAFQYAFLLDMAGWTE
ncbi:MAG: S9 family peptidase [Planctomycetota bacterium]|nr:MAG: S9 family peptidase [Planctomycetota bacterium]